MKIPAKYAREMMMPLPADLFACYVVCIRQALHTLSSCTLNKLLSRLNLEVLIRWISVALSHKSAPLIAI